MPTISWAGNAQQVTVHVDKSKSVEPAYRAQIEKLRSDAASPLTSAQDAELRAMLETHGWPTVIAVGKVAVDDMGDLVKWDSRDYLLQSAVENAADSRIGLDINAWAFAKFNDEIEFKHDGTQQFGMLLAIRHHKVIVDPPVKRASADFLRDFRGMRLLSSYVASVQHGVDQGSSLAAAEMVPALATDYHPYTEPALRQTLGLMIQADEKARNDLVRSGDLVTGVKENNKLEEKVEAADKVNIRKIKKIFSKYGFPTAEMVGIDGVSTAFLLVQHADSDPAFQKRALKLAFPLMKHHELPRQEYGMLVDRVRLAEGKKQVYGTQADIVHGKAVAKPMLDPKDVDIRRQKMAMGSEADYLRSLDQDVSPAAK